MSGGCDCSRTPAMERDCAERTASDQRKRQTPLRLNNDDIDDDDDDDDDVSGRKEELDWRGRGGGDDDWWGRADSGFSKSIPCTCVHLPIESTTDKDRKTGNALDDQEENMETLESDASDCKDSLTNSTIQINDKNETFSEEVSSHSTDQPNDDDDDKEGGGESGGGGDESSGGRGGGGESGGGGDESSGRGGGGVLMRRRDGDCGSGWRSRIYEEREIVRMRMGCEGGLKGGSGGRRDCESVGDEEDVCCDRNSPSRRERRQEDQLWNRSACRSKAPSQSGGCAAAADDSEPMWSKCKRWFGDLASHLTISDCPSPDDCSDQTLRLSRTPTASDDCAEAVRVREICPRDRQRFRPLRGPSKEEKECPCLAAKVRCDEQVDVTEWCRKPVNFTKVRYDDCPCKQEKRKTAKCPKKETKRQTTTDSYGCPTGREGAVDDCWAHDSAFVAASIMAAGVAIAAIYSTSTPD